MRKNNKPLSAVQLFPIIFALGFIPLIVHMFTYSTGLADFDWFPAGSDSQIDFFLAWKAIAIIATGVLMIIIMIYQKVRSRSIFLFENAFYLLFLYLLFVAMSALFSHYKHWVVFGMFELLEPVWVLFAYAIICYYTYNTVRTEAQINSILRFSLIGVVIALLIGVFQSFGLDFLQSKIAGMMMLNPSNWDHIKDIGFTFANYVYITLYNPDYVIFYVGIFLPILIALLINSKKLYAKLIYGVLSIFCIISLIGSKALTGWISLVLAVVISALILLSRNKKKFIISLISFVVVGILGIVFICTNDSMQGLRTAFVGTSKSSEMYGIKSIQTDSDVCIDFNGVNTHFTYDADSEQGSITIYCTDDNGEYIYPVANDDGTSVYTDKNGAEYEVEAIYIENDLGIRITIENHQWVFAKGDDETYYYFNAAGKYVKFPTIKTIELFNDDAVSGRGHMWNKTLPVLGKHVFIGSGANTYLLEIPQEDYLVKNYIDINNNFDVKAHNWFLQQWVENGLFAALLLFAFYFWYMISSIRIYRRISFKENIHRIGFGVFVGLLIYIISTLANDPTVNVAPIYWTVLGLGFAINRMIREKEHFFDTIPSTDDSNSITNEETLNRQIPENVNKVVVTQNNAKKKQSRKKRKQSSKNSK